MDILPFSAAKHLLQQCFVAIRKDTSSGQLETFHNLQTRATRHGETCVALDCWECSHSPPFTTWLVNLHAAAKKHTFKPSATRSGVLFSTRMMARASDEHRNGQVAASSPSNMGLRWDTYNMPNSLLRGAKADTRVFHLDMCC